MNKFISRNQSLKASWRAKLSISEILCVCHPFFFEHRQKIEEKSRGKKLRSRSFKGKSGCSRALEIKVAKCKLWEKFHRKGLTSELKETYRMKAPSIWCQKREKKKNSWAIVWWKVVRLFFSLWSVINRGLRAASVEEKLSRAF